MSLLYVTEKYKNILDKESLDSHNTELQLSLLTEDSRKLAVQKNGCMLKHIKEQTQEICDLAVQQTFYAIQYAQPEFQTEDMIRKAILQNGYALQLIKIQTPEICKLAVKQNGLVLQYVKEQTPELCELAVKQNGYALIHVRNQTEDICIHAVQQNGLALRFVKEQTERILYFSCSTKWFYFTICTKPNRRDM